jgi:hypothetical protein
MRRLLAWLVLLGVAAPASAQRSVPAPASLRVTVQDQTGAVIVGATVEILDDVAATTPLVSGATSADGTITFERLSPGAYVVQARFEGFDSATRDVRLGTGEALRDTITLDVAGMV